MWRSSRTNHFQIIVFALILHGNNLSKKKKKKGKDPRLIPTTDHRFDCTNKRKRSISVRNDPCLSFYKYSCPQGPRRFSFQKIYDSVERFFAAWILAARQILNHRDAGTAIISVAHRSCPWCDNLLRRISPLVPLKYLWNRYDLFLFSSLTLAYRQRWLSFINVNSTRLR